MRKNKIVTNSTRYGYDKNGNINSTTYTTTTDSSKSFGLDMRSGIKVVFSFIFVALLVCLVIRMSFSSEPLSFYSLLTWLQSFNDTAIQSLFNNISDGIKSLSIPTLPSITIFGITIGLSWISDIWNFFVNIEGVVVWLAGNAVYVINFIIQFFRFVFVV